MAKILILDQWLLLVPPFTIRRRNDREEDNEEDDDDDDDDEDNGQQVVPTQPKKKYKSAVTQSTNVLLSWLNNFQKENDRKERERHAEQEQKADDRFRRLEILAEEKNELLRSLLDII